MEKYWNVVSKRSLKYRKVISAVFHYDGEKILTLFKFKIAKTFTGSSTVL